MKTYGYVFGMGLQKALAYRADFLLTLASCIFPILMQVCLWTALYAAGAADTGGYTYEQMILYTLLAGITARIVATGFENDVAQDIKDGGLNKYLVKPVDYGGYYFAQFLGGKAGPIAFLLAVTAAVLAGAAAMLGTAFSPLRLGLYALSLAGAAVLNCSAPSPSSSWSPAAACSRWISSARRGGGWPPRCRLAIRRSSASTS